MVRSSQLPTWWNTFRTAAGGEAGQDLLEFALIVAMACLATTASMSTLASDIARSFR